MIRRSTTWADPPPWIRGVAAWSPKTATRVSDPLWRGNTPSLRNRTTDAAAACRTSACSSGLVPERPGPRPGRRELRRGPVRREAGAPHRRDQPRTRCRPRPGRRCRYRGLVRARASRGRVRLRERSCCRATANQSVMTRPSNPHSSRRRSMRSSRLLGQPASVEAVVGRHDGQGTALTHGQLEGNEIELAEGPFVDDRAHGIALVLRLVGDEVLHRGKGTGRLHAPHVGSRQSAAEKWILGVALEVAPGQRRPVQVDRRCEQSLAATIERLAPDERTESLDEVRVPRGTECRAARDAGGGIAADAGVARSPAPFGPSVTETIGMPTRSMPAVAIMSPPAVRVAFSSRVSVASSASISATRPPVVPTCLRGAAAATRVLQSFAARSPFLPEPFAQPRGASCHPDYRDQRFRLLHGERPDKEV